MDPPYKLSNIRKSFPGILALDNVELTLRAGTIHALLGENGAGKSTLINILGGVHRPDVGKILVHGKETEFADAPAARAAGVAVVHQEGDLFPTLSIAENIALEDGYIVQQGRILWQQLRENTVAALQRMRCNLDPARLADGLSAAERQLVGIAAALARNASLLILDEPTSSLSNSETQVLFQELRVFRANGGTVLYVSHRLEEVFALADDVTVLRDGKLAWHGPLADTSAEELIASMVGRSIDRVAMHGGNSRGHPVLSCRELTAADGSFRSVDLEVHAGEILGLYGLIGAGRTEWALALFGLNPLSTGSIRIDARHWRPSTPSGAMAAGLAYLPEDRLRLGICGGLAVRANLVLGALRRLAHGIFLGGGREKREARSLAAQLRIRCASLGQSIRSLSGGNQQKAVLGRLLACQPRILLLDEPTRGVDLGAKDEIHGILRGLAVRGTAIVLISSDLEEVRHHSDRIGVFRQGSLACIVDPAETSAEEIAALALPVEDRTKSTAPVRTNRNLSHRSANGHRELGLAAAVALISALLVWKTTTFAQSATLQDVAVNAALLALCGLAAGVVILAGALDISFGAIMALGAAVAGFLMQEGSSPLIAIPACLLVTTLAGSLNAVLSLAGRVHPIVITLGTLSAYRGLTFLLIGSKAIHDVPASFRDPLLAAPLSFPVVGWFVIAVMVLAWVILGWTTPGRHIIAQGSNPQAAQRVGIHKPRVWLQVFAIQGFLAGVAGLLALGLAGHLQATDFEEKTLDAIGVAVVGGIAISGGRGSVWGICLAAILFRVLEKGWVLLNISGYWQRTIVGGMLLLAILLDRVWRGGKGEGE